MKFALLIGINYFNTENELSGCINDVIMMREYLLTKNYNIITIMRDDINDSLYPVKNNIIRQLNYIITLANLYNAQELFIHYSGHGTSIVDRNKDEEDGYDEAICPVDLNMISDDDIRSILTGINNNTKVYSVFDCCHSGTVIDLPFIYNDKMKIVKKLNYKDLLQKKIIAVSGCKDNQTSEDAYKVYSPLNNTNSLYKIDENNLNGGALTSCLLKLLNSNISLEKSYSKLLESMKTKYTQIPQFTTSYIL